MKNDNTKGLKRKDKKGRILRTGESQQPDGRYRYSYTVNGKQKSVYSWRLEETDRLPAGKRQCVALRTQERDIQDKMQNCTLATKMTVLQLVDYYLQTQDTQLKLSTKQSHQIAREHMMRDLDFCNSKITDIKITDVKKFFMHLSDIGVPHSTLYIVKAIIFPAFRMAYEDQLISSNPCGFCFSNVISYKSKKKQALTKAQMDVYLDFVRSSYKYVDFYEPLYILFHTGMRISEFCGLTLKDINFRDKTITVCRQLCVSRDCRLYIETPKTASGNRVLPVTDDVADCFRVLVKAAMSRKSQVIVDGVSGFLCYTTGAITGYGETRTYHQHPATGNTWNGRCRMIWEDFAAANPDTDIPRVTPHICRHTYCSQMATAGVPPKVLQSLMGHANIATTIGVYTHTSIDDIRMAVEQAVGCNSN